QGHVAECAVPVVSIQRARILTTLSRTSTSNGSAIGDVEVHPTVIVVVDDRQATSDRFNQESLVRIPAGDNFVEMGLMSLFQEYRNARRGICRRLRQKQYRQGT